MKLPEPLVNARSSACPDCGCGVDKTESCSRCPLNKWGPILCSPEPGEYLAPSVIPLNSVLPPPQIKPPSVFALVQSAMKATAGWASKGFRHTDEASLQHRIETCRACEFWNPQGFHYTGRCMKCGCSTWAKLRMATERCPIGKWGPIPDPSEVSHTTNMS